MCETMSRTVYAWPAAVRNKLGEGVGHDCPSRRGFIPRGRQGTVSAFDACRLILS